MYSSFVGEVRVQEGGKITERSKAKTLKKPLPRAIGRSQPTCSSDKNPFVDGGLYEGVEKASTYEGERRKLRARAKKSRRAPKVKKERSVNAWLMVDSGGRVSFTAVSLQGFRKSAKESPTNHLWS